MSSPITVQETAWSQDTNSLHKKRHRSILMDVKRYLAPQEILDLIMDLDNGWPYTDKMKYLLRDRAMIALGYLGALRVSELLTIRAGQIIFEPQNQRYTISGVPLSKVRSKKNPKWRARLIPFREVWLPHKMKGQDPARLELTDLILNYKNFKEKDDLLFKINRKRAHALFASYTGGWPHYFRAAGMRYLYDAWDHDLIAVCDYIKISERVAMRYLGHFQHPSV